jgi:hypothetical protein
MGQLRLEVLTLAPFAVPGALRVIGRALDVDGAARSDGRSGSRRHGYGSVSWRFGG